MIRLCLLAFVAACSLAGSVQAATGTLLNVKVLRTLQDESRWGGCMAYLDQAVADTGIDCPGRWVTFSCTGDFTTKDVAYKMFDSAVMAMALELDVIVTADDSRKHNGFCYAPRIDLLR